VERRTAQPAFVPLKHGHARPVGSFVGREGLALGWVFFPELLGRLLFNYKVMNLPSLMIVWSPWFVNSLIRGNSLTASVFSSANWVLWQFYLDVLPVVSRICGCWVIAMLSFCRHWVAPCSVTWITTTVPADTNGRGCSSLVHMALVLLQNGPLGNLLRWAWCYTRHH